MTFCQNYYYT